MEVCCERSRGHKVEQRLHCSRDIFFLLKLHGFWEDLQASGALESARSIGQASSAVCQTVAEIASYSAVLG